MNNVVGTYIKINVRVDLSLLGVIETASSRVEATICLLLNLRDDHWNALSNYWHKSVYKHSLNDIISNKCVPGGSIVSELAIEELTCLSIYFIQISIDEQNQYSSVEELCYKDSVSDLRKHLRMCIISYPSYQEYRNFCQNLIDHHNDNCNAICCE